MSRVASATRLTPITALPPDRSMRQAAPTIVPGCSLSASRVSREESPVVMMSSTIRTRAPGGIENRLGAEPSCGLVARHDAADRRRRDDVDRAKRLARLVGEGPAQAFGAGR